MTKSYYLVKVKKKFNYETVDKIFTNIDKAIRTLYKEIKMTKRNTIIYDLLEMERQRIVLNKITVDEKVIFRLTEVRSDFFNEHDEYNIILGEVIAITPE